MLIASLITVLASGGFTFVLVALFRHERRRGARYASAVRVLFDRSLAETKAHWGGAFRRLTGRTLRQSVRYVFHRILTSLLRRIGRLEQSLRFIVHLNRRRANRVEESSPSAHLSTLADHKRETELSKEEQRQKRDEALNSK